MNIINYSDIDFNRLDKYRNHTFSKNDFYLQDRNIIYKIFNNISIEDSNIKKEKIEAFKELNKKYVSNAKEIIIDNGITKGYTSKFYEADTLNDLIHKKNILNVLKIIIQTSKNLEDFHNSDGKPVIGDMHFGNIIVDTNNNPIFVDHDSFGIYDLEADYIPSILNGFLNYYNEPIEKNQNMDRLSFLLSVFYMIFKKSILLIDSSIYRDYIYEYPFLEDLYKEFTKLRYGHKVNDVPYLHYILKQ